MKFINQFKKTDDRKNSVEFYSLETKQASRRCNSMMYGQRRKRPSSFKRTVRFNLPARLYYSMLILKMRASQLSSFKCDCGAVSYHKDCDADDRVPLTSAYSTSLCITDPVCLA